MEKEEPIWAMRSLEYSKVAKRERSMLFSMSLILAAVIASGGSPKTNWAKEMG